MSDIIVEKVNEVYVRLVCDDGIKADLSDYFSFFAPNYQFSPLYKKRIWNGKIYLFSKKTALLYGGLIVYLREFCKDRNLTLSIDKSVQEFTDFTEDQAKEFISSLNIHSRGKPIEPRDYQIQGFLKTVKYKKILILSPTASGKSLIIYTILRYLLQNGSKRGLLIVPTVSLVEQMYGDFKDYSSANAWDTDLFCQKVYQGQSKIPNVPVIISTWQSIYEMPKKYFQQFDFIIGDEAHQYKAKSLSNIMTKLTNTKYRVGTTGTITDDKVSKLTLEGHFGPAVRVATTKELMDKKQLSDLKINCLVLKHPKEACEKVKEMEFQEEMDFIVSNNSRNKFITNLALDLKGNTLILFQYVAKHGELLYNMMIEKTKHKNRKVFFVHGGTDKDDREQIRHIVEKEENAIIIASFGVFSTGVNIPRLHNAILASPSKAKIRNLQSIGRILRLGEGKDSATLYDIVDDLRIKNYINYTLKHYAERVKVYHAEKFKISTYKVELKNE